MNRFVAGVAACLLLVTGGLFWWQGQAENRAEPAPERVAVPSAPQALPEGNSNAMGAPPPVPPEARPEDREAKRFDRYDRDRNGVISRLEMMSSRTSAFKALDKDGNNLLSFEEWAVRTSDRFAGADGDKDGKLTRAEFATTAPKPVTKPKCKC
ncbi:MAG: hypothetical protein AB7U35_06840 [Sphingobium sp.]